MRDVQLPADDLAWLQVVRPTLTSLVRNKAISDRDIVVYLIMRSMANYSSGEIELTKINLAKIFDMAEQKIARAIMSLRGTGYLKSKKTRGRNSYVCIDTSTLSDKQVRWNYAPKKFGKISEQLKKMVNCRHRLIF